MNNQLISIGTLIILFFSPSAYAEKTYTPDQLRRMVNSGNPPEQVSPTTQTKTMPFDSCIISVDTIIDSIEPNYPTKVIAKTNIVYTVKIWTNDAAMTLSCSQPDRKLVITTAKYL